MEIVWCSMLIPIFDKKFSALGALLVSRLRMQMCKASILILLLHHVADVSLFGQTGTNRLCLVSMDVPIENLLLKLCLHFEVGDLIVALHLIVRSILILHLELVPVLVLLASH